MSSWQWASTPEKLRGAVSAAEDLFLEKGFNATTVNDISAASGLSTSSLYHHFKAPREELRELVLERMIDELFSEVRADDMPRSYLLASWHYRLRVKILAAGGLGFVLGVPVRAATGHDRLSALLPEDGPVHELLIAIAREGAYLAAACSTRRELDELIPLVSTAMRVISALNPGQNYAGPS